MINANVKFDGDNIYFGTYLVYFNMGDFDYYTIEGFDNKFVTLEDAYTFFLVEVK